MLRRRLSAIAFCSTILVSSALVGDRLQGCATAADDKAKPAEGRILVLKEGKNIFVTPDGKSVGDLPAHPEKLFPLDPALSPDGKRVAYIVQEKPSQDREGNYKRHVFVGELEGKGDGSKFEIVAQTIAWTPDGKLLAAEAGTFKDLRERKFTNYLVDVARKDKTRLDLPESTQVFGMTPDGKSLLAETYDSTAKKLHLSLISRDGKTTTPLTEIPARTPGLSKNPRLSPDGTRILFMASNKDEKLDKGMPRLPRLYVYDLKGQKRERLEDVPLNALLMGYAWSPDSKRIVYSWKRMEPGVPMAFNLDDLNNPKLQTETESHLTVADASGKNPKAILSAKSPVGPAMTIGSVDWQ